MENYNIQHIPLEEVKNKVKTAKWGKRLDDYNNYVKEYLTHYKKSLTGNLISLTKYPYMKLQSEVLAAQIEKAKVKSILTEKQIKRFSKIKAKIINACCE